MRFGSKAGFSFLSFLFAMIVFSCSREVLPEELDTAKEIVSYTFKKADGSAFTPSAINVIISKDSIRIILPAGTDITNLVPEITISGLSISPASGVKQNFQTPVQYTVTAADGSTTHYIVIVTVAKIKGVVYIGTSDNNFYALNKETGTLLWKYPGTHSFAYSNATYKDGVVYVGGIDSYVYAFDAATGNVRWRYKAGDTGIESDAVISDNTVYVGSNDDHLYALDAATGTLNWKYLTGANVSSSPVIADGMVYFGSSDHNLYALTAATGQLVWKYSTGAMINQSGPCLSNGILYVGSRDAYLHAVDAATGSMKWKFSTNGISLEASSPTVAGGVAYIGGWYNIGNFSLKGSVYALNANTGALIWEGLSQKAFSSSPVVSNGRLFIGCDDGNINALNITDGSLIWKKQILPNSSCPVESNGVVYVGGGGTRFIYALDAATGNEVWKFSTPDGLMASSPLIVDESGEVHYPGDSGALQ